MLPIEEYEYIIKLKREDACEGALAWLCKQHSLAHAWENQGDVDWLIWLISHCPNLKNRVIELLVSILRNASLPQDVRDALEEVLPTLERYVAGNASRHVLRRMRLKLDRGLFAAVYNMYDYDSRENHALGCAHNLVLFASYKDGAGYSQMAINKASVVLEKKNASFSAMERAMIRFLKENISFEEVLSGIRMMSSKENPAPPWAK